MCIFTAVDIEALAEPVKPSYTPPRVVYIAALNLDPAQRLFVETLFNKHVDARVGPKVDLAVTNGYIS